MPDGLDDVIEDAASGPKEAKGDMGSFTTHSLADLIKADEYLTNKRAAKKKGLGIRFTKIIPPGSEG